MPGPRGSTFLIVILAVTVVANAAGIFKIALTGDELLAAHPKLTPTALNALYACPVAAIVGAISLWLRRTWGFWLLLADAAVVVAVDLHFGLPAVHLAAVVTLTALLVWATPKKHVLRARHQGRALR